MHLLCTGMFGGLVIHYHLGLSPPQYKLQVEPKYSYALQEAYLQVLHNLVTLLSCYSTTSRQYHEKFLTKQKHAHNKLNIVISETCP